MGRHLFLAVTRSAMGAAQTGMRLAASLGAAGDEVVFVAPAALRLPAAAGVRRLDVAVNRGNVLALLNSERCDSLCFVDLTSVHRPIAPESIDFGALTRTPVPMVVVDPWELGRTDLRWDVLGEAQQLDPSVRALPRLTPAPLGRPGAPNAYRDLPDDGPAPDRREVRARLGVGADEPMIFLATAGWQLGRLQTHPVARRLARAVPELLAAYLRALPGTRVVHVGPEPLRALASLGDRHRFSPPLARDRFAELVRSADLVLGLDAASGTLATAVAAEVPVLLVSCARSGATPDVVAAELGAPLGERARAWLELETPYPFSAWPIGLHDFLGAVLADNPFRAAVASVELLDEEAFMGSCRALLFGGQARADLLRAQRAYREEIAALPAGHEAYRRSVGGA